MMFLPQRPYLPLGTLASAVSYPKPADTFAREDIEAALERVGLGEFIPQLDREERWDQVLSVGQQQRLGFARLLLHKPRWVFLDESTGALDEENQNRVMSIFEQELAGSAVVSIGHRPGLEKFHTRTLEVVTSSGGAMLRRKPRKKWRRES
jgi:putative ATP-binding cassette transporter